MSDWYKGLVSGFNRAIASTNANQHARERDAQHELANGLGFSGLGGVAAALGTVASGAGSAESRVALIPRGVGGRLLDSVRGSAFIVLQTTTHIPAGAAAAVPAVVARLVPGTVFNDRPQQLPWTNRNYGTNVTTVYWDLAAAQYNRLPTPDNFSTTLTAQQRNDLLAMNAVATACQGYFGGTGPAATGLRLHLRVNAPNGGHYFKDVVFTQTGGRWQPVAPGGTTAPVTWAPLLPTTSRRMNGASSLDNIYNLYATGLRVWATTPAGFSPIAGAGGIGGGIVDFDPIARTTSAMILQGGNFVCSQYNETTGAIATLAPPGHVYNNGAQLYTTLPGPGVPVYTDLEGTGPPPAATGPSVAQVAVPAAGALNVGQPMTLVVGRLLQPRVGAPPAIANSTWIESFTLVLGANTFTAGEMNRLVVNVGAPAGTPPVWPVSLRANEGALVNVNVSATQLPI